MTLKIFLNDSELIINKEAYNLINTDRCIINNKPYKIVFISVLPIAEVITIYVEPKI